jgi:hypothetical protein
VAPRLEAMRLRLPGLAIRLSTEELPAGLAPAQRRTFFACARFLLLPEILAHYRAPVLMLDIDAVVLRDVGPLLQQLATEAADLALIHARGADPWARLWADVVLAAPTPAALRYFERVRRYILFFLQQGRAIWFLDQVALFAVWVSDAGESPGLRLIEWPADIQNSNTSHAYFWSLHVSQPSNAAAPESPFYRAFQENRP